MTRVHLEEPGAWVVCGDEGSCMLPIHLPDLNPAAAARIPLELLLPIVNAQQLADFSSDEGRHLIWMDEHGYAHRDYDLPAVIDSDGTLGWFQHEERHRDGDKPAVVNPHEGRLEWWRDGYRHRENGPAVVYTITEGSVQFIDEWWVNGKLVVPPIEK